MMEKMVTSKKSRWYYIPEKKWFENRKQAKEYLGGTNAFNAAFNKRDIIFVQI